MQELELRARHAEARARHAEARMRELEQQRDTALAQAKEALSGVQAIQDRLQAMETSTSWRVAAPLRRLELHHPWLIRLLRQSARAARRKGPRHDGAAASPVPAPSPHSCGNPWHPAGSDGPPAAAKAAGGPAILVIDHAVPRPDQDAGSRAIMDLMLCLRDAGWRIRFWPQDRLWVAGYTPALEALGIEPVDDRWSGGLAAWLDAHGRDLDHVLVSRATVAHDLIMPVLAHSAARLTFYGHDLAFARQEMEAAILDRPEMLAEAERARAFERRLWRLFDGVIYLSDEEAAVVRAMEPTVDARSIIPFSYDAVLERAAAPRSRTILFVAGFAHAPNVDAAEFLVHQVLPLVQARCPGVTLALVGSHPNWAVSALAGPAVEVTGWVSDAQLAQRYEQSRVAVVPLRVGAGVKGKVVQALQQGLPVVVTPVGAQGIPGLDGVVPVREAPQAIAEALLNLLEDDAAWLAQSAAQSRFAAAHYSRAAMRASVLRALAPQGPVTPADGSPGSTPRSVSAR